MYILAFILAANPGHLSGCYFLVGDSYGAGYPKRLIVYSSPVGLVYVLLNP